MAYTDDIMTIANSRTTFKFTVTMHRVSTDILITAFFPTCLLWLLSYFTLFIKIDNFNEKIMVAATLLVVLAALLNSINDDLPRTSYFMYIDLWFGWHTGNIFSIAAFHILLHEVDDNRSGKLLIRVDVGIINTRNNQKITEKSKKVRLNDMAKMLFLIVFLIFNFIYFPFQLSTNHHY